MIIWLLAVSLKLRHLKNGLTSCACWEASRREWISRTLFFFWVAREYSSLLASSFVVFLQGEMVWKERVSHLDWG